MSRGRPGDVRLSRAASVALFAAVAWLGSACDAAFRFDQDGGTSSSDGGALSPCSSDPDCPSATPHCDVSAAECVACFHDTDCASLVSAGSLGGHCDRSHECVACEDDFECDHTHACDAIAHTCVPRCDDDRGCPSATPTCNQSRGYCIACATSADCPDHEPVCDAPTGKCGACTNDTQCAHSRPRCDSSGFCVQCESSADCPSGHACEPVLHICI